MDRDGGIPLKKTTLCTALFALVILATCRSESIQYSRALFEHIPAEPELLVLVRPNDISRLAETAAEKLRISDFFEGRFDFDLSQIKEYETMAIQLIEAVGIPYDDVETVGLLLFFEQPVILVSGAFEKATVEADLAEIGFKQGSNGYFEYIYNDFRLNVAEDGLIILAREALLEDLSYVPEDERLWNREDFARYRLSSPLDNSLFIWTHPPDRFLAEFDKRELLGDVSFAMDFGRNISANLTVRVSDPRQTVLIHDIVLGAVALSKLRMGDDPDLGPILKGIKVTQDNKQVTATVVVPADHVGQVIDKFRSGELDVEALLMNFFGQSE